MRSFFANTVLLLVSQLLAACATPYVHPQSPEHATPVLTRTHAIMDDGYRLPLSRWEANGHGHTLVLAVHGMNDYSNAFASTGDYLAERGISLIAYDQRGFGNTEGHGYWHGSERLVEDVRIMARLLRESHPDRKLYLLGESMGGAVILASFNPHPPDVDGIILVAPAVWSRDTMPFYQRLALWLAAHTVPAKQLTGEGLDLKPSDNIEMLRALGRDPLVIKATRVDVLYGMSNLMDDAMSAAPALNNDALILYGIHDQIIPKQPTCRWLKRLSMNREKQWDVVFYENGYHMLTRDLQADVVLQDISDWLLELDNYPSVPDNAGGGVPNANFCTP